MAKQKHDIGVRKKAAGAKPATHKKREIERLKRSLPELPKGWRSMKTDDLLDELRKARRVPKTT